MGYLSRIVLLLIFTVGVAWGWYDNPPSIALDDIVKECSNHANRTKFIACVTTNFDKSKTSFSVRGSMMELEQLFTLNERLRENQTMCHDISHAIGQYASKHDVETGVALAECSPICTAGCYHGVIEGVIAKTGEIPKNVGQVCKRKSFLTQSSYEGCLHGLGHGIANIVGLDLVKSLEKCDELDPDDRQYCGGGVMMELYEMGSYEHAKLEYPANSLDLCASLWGAYQKLCYDTSGARVLGKSNDLAKAISMCNQVPSESKRECAVGVGAHMYYSGEWLDSNGEFRCNEFEGKLSSQCLKGLAVASLNADPEAVLYKQICLDYSDEFEDQVCGESNVID